MTDRPIQQIILAAWEKSGYIPADIIRAMPTVTPHNVRRYLAGDPEVRMSEANLDTLLLTIQRGPKTKKPQ